MLWFCTPPSEGFKKRLALLRWGRSVAERGALTISLNAATLQNQPIVSATTKTPHRRFCFQLSRSQKENTVSSGFWVDKLHFKQCQKPFFFLGLRFLLRFLEFIFAQPDEFCQNDFLRMLKNISRCFKSFI